MFRTHLRRMAAISEIAVTNNSNATFLSHGRKHFNSMTVMVISDSDMYAETLHSTQHTRTSYALIKMDLFMKWFEIWDKEGEKRPMPILCRQLHVTCVYFTNADFGCFLIFCLFQWRFLFAFSWRLGPFISTTKIRFLDDVCCFYKCLRVQRDFR